MVTLGRGAGAQSGRGHRQELPARGRIVRLEQSGGTVSDFRRIPGRTAHPHDHGRLDQKAGRISDPEIGQA